MKKNAIIFLTLSLCLCLFGCGKDPNKIYMTQSVKGAVEDEDILSAVCSVCECLGYSESIPCFDDWADVSEEYSLIILDYLATRYYTKYSADSKLFAALAEHYPTLSVSTMIPASDLENAVYRSFGGYERVTHKTLPEYSYLTKINAYLSVGNRDIQHSALSVLSCDETEDTYRLRASFENKGIYDIILVKRKDGDPYIISVQALNSEQ